LYLDDASRDVDAIHLPEYVLHTRFVARLFRLTSQQRNVVVAVDDVIAAVRSATKKAGVVVLDTLVAPPATLILAPTSAPTITSRRTSVYFQRDRTDSVTCSLTTPTHNCLGSRVSEFVQIYHKVQMKGLLLVKLRHCGTHQPEGMAWPAWRDPLRSDLVLNHLHLLRQSCPERKWTVNDEDSQNETVEGGIGAGRRLLCPNKYQ
jgi:hypothetical protein